MQEILAGVFILVIGGLTITAISQRRIVRRLHKRLRSTEIDGE